MGAAPATCEADRPTVGNGLLAAAISFSRAKLEIQAQDYNVSLASELLQAIEEFQGERFAPADLLPHLVGDTWGEKLSKCSNDRDKAARVGRFLGRFRLESRAHTRTGTTYLRQEAMVKLAAHTPARNVTTVTAVTERAGDGETESAGDTVTDVTDIANGALTDFSFPESNETSEFHHEAVATDEIEI